MKLKFDLTAAALLASSAHLASTTSTMTVSYWDDTGSPYTQDRPLPDAARVVARDHATWPPSRRILRLRQASDSHQQPRKGTACDIANIRAAREKMQQLLSDLRNASDTAMEQLEAIEMLLQGMEEDTSDSLTITSSSMTKATNEQIHTTSARTSSDFTDTSAIASSTSSDVTNVPGPYSNRSSAILSQSSDTPTSKPIHSGIRPVFSPSITASHDSSQPVKVIPITTGFSRTGVSTVKAGYATSSEVAAVSPPTTTQSKPSGMAATVPSTATQSTTAYRATEKSDTHTTVGDEVTSAGTRPATMSKLSSVLRSTSTLTVSNGAKTTSSGAPGPGASSTAINSDSSWAESSQSIGGSRVTTKISAINSFSILPAKSSTILGDSQTISRTRIDATVSDSSQMGSSGATGETSRSVTRFIPPSNSMASSSTKSSDLLVSSQTVPQSSASGTGVATSALKGGSGNSNVETTTVTVVPTETQIITISKTSEAPSDSYSSIISSSLRIGPFTTVSSSAANAESGTSSSRLRATTSKEVSGSNYDVINQRHPLSQHDDH
ncbi:hypothetical protein PG990_008024 [Apiospora arundinis]